MIRLVAWRDFWDGFSTRSYQISTAVVVVIVVALIVVPRFIDASPTWTIGVVGEPDQTMEDAIAAAAPDEETSVEVVAHVTADEAEQALRDGDVDMVVAEDVITTNPGADPTMVATVTAVVGTLRFVEAAEAAGLDTGTTTDLLTSTQMEVVELEPEEGEADVGAAFIASILLFVAIVTYGQWILNGVVAEKASRVVEIVLGTVRPHHLLAGKIIGIGTLGVIQLIAVGIAATVAGTIGGTFEVPAGVGGVAWIVLMWFFLGYAFYASAFAAAGSLVSRVEDAQNAAFPLTLLLMVGYFTAAFSIAGDNPVLQIMSLLPPFAPVTMSVRMAAGTAAPWEVVVSVVLMVGAIWLLVRVAGRIYAGGLLQVGRRTKVGEAWTAAR